MCPDFSVSLLQPQSLSRKFSNSGMPTLSPFLFLTAATSYPALVASSYGSVVSISQWSNTHCGKALPDVSSLKC